MRIGRIRMSLGKDYSDNTVKLLGKYVRCERVDDEFYDVIVQNDMFHDVPIDKVPYYKPVIQTRYIRNGTRGKYSKKQAVHRFKRVNYGS